MNPHILWSLNQEMDEHLEREAINIQNPMKYEIKRVIEEIKNGKAAGMDNIT